MNFRFKTEKAHEFHDVLKSLGVRHQGPAPDDNSASPVESTSGGPLKRNSTGQARNNPKTGWYSDEAYHFLRNIEIIGRHMENILVVF